MKKVLAGLTVLAFVFIASSAMASGVKVPKLLCLDFVSYTDTNQLAFKSSGAIMNGDVKVVTYTVTGSDLRGPVVGSAYVLPGSTTLRAVYTSTNTINAPQQSATYNLTFDLATGTGTLDMLFVSSTGSIFKQASTVNSMACDMAYGPAEETTAAPSTGKQ